MCEKSSQLMSLTKWRGGVLKGLFSKISESVLIKKKQKKKTWSYFPSTCRTYEWQHHRLNIVFSASELLLPHWKGVKVYRYGEWKENKAHWKQQHRTSLLAHQSIVMLLSFSCAQQVHLGKATSTTAKNLLFLSALVDITSIIALQFAQRKKKKCLPVF